MKVLDRQPRPSRHAVDDDLAGFEIDFETMLPEQRGANQDLGTGNECRLGHDRLAVEDDLNLEQLLDDSLSRGEH